MKKLDGITTLGNFRLTYSGISDKGRIRIDNEDDFLVIENHTLFCVADGMGGQESGKLASKTTIQSVARCMDYFQNTEDTTIPSGLTKDMLEKPMLESVTHFANFQVNNKSVGRTMGSTLVAAHFTENGLDIVHVGDSRLYLWREGQLTQLTEDHSLVYELFKMGKIAQKEIHGHQMKNVITRAIGTDSTVEPTLSHIEVLSGDVYLLCSDGLTTMLKAHDMIKTFKNESNLTALAQSFINQANDAGGRDNVTVLLVSVQDTVV